MESPHLLSVGYDKYLMHSRALVLRHAGFIVDEAFNLNGALGVVKADSIDAIILCHTIAKEEQVRLIAAVREVKKLLPIICINATNFDLSPSGCINAYNDPAKLLNAIRSAVRASPSA
jgi:DNA-binding response OmpR family regulator